MLAQAGQAYKVKSSLKFQSHQGKHNLFMSFCLIIFEILEEISLEMNSMKVKGTTDTIFLALRE